MKSIFKLFLFFVSICFLELEPQAQNEISYYIKCKKTKDVEPLKNALKKEFTELLVYTPFETISFDNLNRIIRIDVSAQSAEYVLKSIVESNVEYIEKVPYGALTYTPNDIGIELGSPNQWYHYKIQAKSAWDYSKGSENTVIAIVDNGFLTDHPDLQDKIAINSAEVQGDGIDNDSNGFIDDFEGWNATQNNGDVYIVSSNSDHGTHVAGIAAAHTDNNIGMASIGFNSRWLPVKASNSLDVVTHGYEGIAFAASRNADVINCSWGSLDSSATAKSVINFALSKGCFIVCSAGNFANETPVYPATYEGVISVAATTQNDAKLNISSFGRRINISAPGSGIWSTSKTATAAPSYAFKSGTSMASPLVAGLLGLMKGYVPDGDSSVILNCLYSTAVEIDNVPANSAYDSLLGNGRIHAELAMKCLYDFYNLSNGEVNTAVDFTLFPNPSENEFHIGFTHETETILWEINDLSGRKIIQGKGNTGNLSTLAAGVYLITVQKVKNNQTFSTKIIKY